MTEKTIKPHKDVQLTTLQPGKAPPCTQPTFGNCRGCFGWQAMIDAACNGDPVWQRTPIHCPVTGLTVKVEKKN
ncbi:MAG: hypothetical protein GWP07_05535 [Xanthomonadaceae bacterium]|nr:hypothetical protein [Xanthomonadaceae bacterium]